MICAAISAALPTSASADAMVLPDFLRFWPNPANAYDGNTSTSATGFDGVASCHVDSQSMIILRFAFMPVIFLPP